MQTFIGDTRLLGAAEQLNPNWYQDWRQAVSDLDCGDAGEVSFSPPIQAFIYDKACSQVRSVLIDALTADAISVKGAKGSPDSTIQISEDLTVYVYAPMTQINEGDVVLAAYLKDDEWDVDCFGNYDCYRGSGLHTIRWYDPFSPECSPKYTESHSRGLIFKRMPLPSGEVPALGR